MPTFVIEAYGSRGAVADQRARAARAAETAPEIRYVRTTFLPEDETVLHVFEARSAEALRLAACEVALSFDRIVEAIEGHEGRRAAGR